MRTCEYFDLEELVSEQVFKKYGQEAWGFFDPRALIVLDWIRKELDSPILVNNWVWKEMYDEDVNIFHERGFRCNQDSIPKKKTNKGIIYCSPHMRGMAFDINVSSMAVQEVIYWLEENEDRIPYNIRIELDDVNRLHFDVIDKDVPIYYFGKYAKNGKRIAA